MQLPDIITTYIDQLNDREHERLMTTELIPHTIGIVLGEGVVAGCLIGVARGAAEAMKRRSARGVGWLDSRSFIPQTDWSWSFDPATPFHEIAAKSLATVFNRLADQDQPGTQQAIRDYILQLRAKRAAVEAVIEESAEVPEEVAV